MHLDGVEVHSDAMTGTSLQGAVGGEKMIPSERKSGHLSVLAVPGPR